MDAVLLWNNSDYTSEYIQGASMVRNDLWESFEGDRENESCTREKVIGPQSDWNTGSEEVNQKDMVGVCEQEDKDLDSSEGVSGEKGEGASLAPSQSPGAQALTRPPLVPSAKASGEVGPSVDTLISRPPSKESFTVALLSAKHREWKAVLGALA